MLYDKDIREPLFEYLEEKHGKVRIIEEKVIGKSRADVVMVLDDCIVGIEIKSDADTYARLERQVKDYNTHFDYNIVAVGAKHGAHIKEHVPEWWGIITIDEIDGKPDFYMCREMLENPKANVKKQLAFLWRPELVRLLEYNKMPKYKEKSKKFVVNKIYECVDKETLKKQISNELFERDYTTISQVIAEYKKKIY